MSPARGVRRIELGAAEPEPTADFYASLLGWVIIAEPDGAFTGWVGDRLAVRVHPGPPGFRVVFAGPAPRALRPGAAVDTGRVLHGPWAPEPRFGEPCWVELMGEADDDYWTGELGWTARTPADPFTVYEVGEDPRAVAGRLVGEGGWTCYFSVPDTAAAVKTAVELGGTVVVDTQEVPTGLVAAIADPSGAVFAVLQDPVGWGGAWAKS